MNENFDNSSLLCNIVPNSRQKADIETWGKTMHVSRLGPGVFHPDDITDDAILLLLDVNKTVSEYMPAGQGISMLKAQYQIAIKYIRAGELAQKGWVDFEVPFYSDAQGVWEYRLHAYDGLDNKPDNISHFGKEVRIFFDTVTIQEIKEFQVPTA